MASLRRFDVLDESLYLPHFGVIFRILLLENLLLRSGGELQAGGNLSPGHKLAFKVALMLSRSQASRLDVRAIASPFSHLKARGLSGRLLGGFPWLRAVDVLFQRLHVLFGVPVDGVHVPVLVPLKALGVRVVAAHLGPTMSALPRFQALGARRVLRSLSRRGDVRRCPRRDI